MRLSFSPVTNRPGNRFAALLIAAAIVVGGVSFTLGQSINGSGDVQIVAQKLEDGRIEFGLEQDGERILPRSRFFPADARVGRWLKSSVISVERSTSPETSSSSTLSASGRGDDYVSAGYASAGNYRCSISLTGNSAAHGETYFGVVSYGADGSYGKLHANEITAMYSGGTQLSVGTGWTADVPPGNVYFEVSAVGSWSISCSTLN